LFQEWFVLMTRLATTIRGHWMSWQTPLGWKVIQHYSKRNVVVDDGVKAIFMYDIASILD
jgi:hypothetical protein